MENNNYQVWRKIQKPINEREFLLGRTVARELAGKRIRLNARQSLHPPLAEEVEEEAIIAANLERRMPLRLRTNHVSLVHDVRLRFPGAEAVIVIAVQFLRIDGVADLP